jgi:hypothetical protein
MASVIDVCNRALDKVGQSPIISLSDGNKAANLCDRAWPAVRDKVLRAHKWNFATKRKILAPLTEAPVWGFAYKHPIPSDCLRLLEINDVPAEQYELESGHILTDDAVLRIRYIFRNTDPNTYDSLCIETMASRLAYELAEPLTQSTQKKQELFVEYEDMMNQAKRIDAQENPVILFEEDSWITCRR